MAPVKLGSNRAAQVHADGLLANCHGGHWSTDGLKPYMRYTLAGGYQVNAENVSGSSYCFDEEGLQLLDTALTVAMDGLMKSKGHRKNILNPTHRAVSLGISCDDDFRCAVVQIFEGEYIEYHSLPLIRDGILSLSATAVGGAGFSSDDDLIVVLQWDPPPRALTRGQLARTSSYGGGVPIVGIVRSREGGNIPPRPLKYRPPYDPHSVPADMAPPQSWEETKELYLEAKQASAAQDPPVELLPMLGALEWNRSANDFEVVADVGEFLETLGPGVYTVHVWAVLEGNPFVISEYSIWHGVEKPGGYQ